MHKEVKFYTWVKCYKFGEIHGHNFHISCGFCFVFFKKSSYARPGGRLAVFLCLKGASEEAPRGLRRVLECPPKALSCQGDRIKNPRVPFGCKGKHAGSVVKFDLLSLRFVVAAAAASASPETATASAWKREGRRATVGES